ncbi:hypothetical protein COP2_004233 [Malus domestica]
MKFSASRKFPSCKHVFVLVHERSPPFDMGIPDEEELIIKTLINMRLLSTQMLRPELEEVEEDTFLQKGWKDRKLFIVTVETS